VTAERLASCHCGQLRLRCVGKPTTVSMCHCEECQRRTGSAFSIAAFFERGAVSVVIGEAKTFTRDSASGYPVTFGFCPECGSNLFWEPRRMPHLIGIAVGAFADPNFPQPEQSVWTEDKHVWISLPRHMRTFTTNSPPRQS
jgi:hypothetical protein